jgi:ketosteroid isomerase-like protein
MPERSPEVEQVVRVWLEAKQAGDAAAIRARLSDYGDALAIGTEASEWWAGAGDFAEAHVAGGAFAATLEHVEAHRHGAVAWAAVRAVIETGEAGGMPVRLTLVLVSQGDAGWRIVQSHVSVPDTA